MFGPHIRDWYRTNRRRLVLGSSCVMALLFLGTISYGASCGYRGCPSQREIRAYAATHGAVPLKRIPESVQDAFIAVEDRRFTEHHGIDWRAFGRAFVRNTTSFEVREGASTITMQLARTAFIPGEACQGRSLRRKLIELRLARLIERSLTKDQILQLYLNRIYLGDGRYGVEAASRHHFGKSVAKLSVAEAAMLAALPRAPSVYDPEDYPERARSRRNLVLSLMAKEGYLTVRQANGASGQPLRVAGQPRRSAAAPRAVARTSSRTASQRGSCAG